MRKTEKHQQTELSAQFCHWKALKKEDITLYETAGWRKARDEGKKSYHESKNSSIYVKFKKRRLMCSHWGVFPSQMGSFILSLKAAMEQGYVITSIR